MCLCSDDSGMDEKKSSPETPGSEPEFGESPTPFEELQKLTTETPNAENENSGEDKEGGVHLDGNKVYL